jgi:hypothetical protein
LGTGENNFRFPFYLAWRDLARTIFVLGSCCQKLIKINRKAESGPVSASRPGPPPHPYPFLIFIVFPIREANGPAVHFYPYGVQRKARAKLG